MNEVQDDKLKSLLKNSMPPVSRTLDHDLWPQMLKRLDQDTARRRFSFVDWALVAVLVGCVIAFPHSIPVLLYHL